MNGLVMAIVATGLSALEWFLSKPTAKSISREAYRARKAAIYAKKL